MATTWRRALVTGASSGIGRAIALQLSAEGVALVVVARDTKRLEALAAECAPTEVEVLTADLTDSGQVSAVETRLRDPDRPIDLLVNNAGFGLTGHFVDLDIDTESAEVLVNAMAPPRFTPAAGYVMAQRGRGGILNISSLADRLVAPRGATYAASKAFVTSFSEALHEELKPRGVTVTVSCPGYTRTEFHARAGIEPGGPSLIWQDAGAVARQSLAAVDAGRATVVPGRVNKAAALLLHLTPRWMIRKISNSR